MLVLSIIKTSSDITGYDLIQEINNKFKDLWKASAGTIYPLLNRLEERGFIASKEITEGGRQKKLFNITIKGKEELKNILENNLEISLQTLGDYIKTIVKASVPEDQFFNQMIAFFPFPKPPFRLDKIDASDCSLENIKKVENRIRELRNHLKRMKKQEEYIENQIEEHERLRDLLIAERHKNAKNIEIVDDDEEFENF